MNIISIDLGTTNIKVSVYDQKLHLIATLSETVQYDRNGNFVEFDSDRYFHSIEDMIRKAAGTGKAWDLAGSQPLPGISDEFGPLLRLCGGQKKKQEKMAGEDRDQSGRGGCSDDPFPEKLSPGTLVST